MYTTPSNTYYRPVDMQLLKPHLGAYGLNNAHLSGHRQNSQTPPLLLPPLLLSQQMNYCSNLSKFTHPSVLGLSLGLSLDLGLAHSHLKNAKSLQQSPSFSTTLQYIQNLMTGLRALIIALEILTNMISASFCALLLTLGLLEFTIWSWRLISLQIGRS